VQAVNAEEILASILSVILAFCTSVHFALILLPALRIWDDHHIVAFNLKPPNPLNTVKMSDNGEVEVENPTSSYQVLPKEVTSEIGSIKLFNKWSYEDVEIRDISLTYGPRYQDVEKYDG